MTRDEYKAYMEKEHRWLAMSPSLRQRIRCRRSGTGLAEERTDHYMQKLINRGRARRAAMLENTATAALYFAIVIGFLAAVALAIAALRLVVHLVLV
jgi:hypothetical protein